jgi:Protein of unknown function (DUF4236)
MGFYLRKSVKVGPLRFNLSKSGIGVSAGVRGLRFGTGPRGNYVHMGRHGIYYRATLPSAHKAAAAPTPTPIQPTPHPQVAADGLAEIRSGDFAEMVDSSSAALLVELNEKQKKLPLWPWVSAAFAILVLWSLNSATVASMNADAVLIAALFVAGAVGTFATHRYDTLRRSTVLLYNLDEEAGKRYQAVHDAFDVLAKCGGRWHIDAQGKAGDPKYHAGANTLMRRTTSTLRTTPPSIVKTNIAVPAIPAGRNTMYFFPDRLLIFGPSNVGAVPYDALKIDVASTRFIESGSVPSDATVVGQTWKYVNKNGGPDKRFKNNRQLPIALYEELRFSSASGVNEIVQVSTAGAGKPFADSLTQLKTTPAVLSQADISPATITPPAPARTAAQQARDAQRRAEYEKEFPYDKPEPPVERLSRRSPTVSGGLPSLGKRKP